MIHGPGTACDGGREGRESRLGVGEGRGRGMEWREGKGERVGVEGGREWW